MTNYWLIYSLVLYNFIENQMLSYFNLKTGPYWAPGDPKGGHFDLALFAASRGWRLSRALLFVLLFLTRFLIVAKKFFFATIFFVGPSCAVQGFTQHLPVGEGSQGMLSFLK